MYGKQLFQFLDLAMNLFILLLQNQQLYLRAQIIDPLHVHNQLILPIPKIDINYSPIKLLTLPKQL